MKAILLAVMAIALVWAYFHYQAATARRNHPASIPAAPSNGDSLRDPTPRGNFLCDGRKYCSQMTSCEEATFFLRNCPDTKMDGDGDGVPCERQWCRGR
jgi:hypothetical protein